MRKYAESIRLSPNNFEEQEQVTILTLVQSTRHVCINCGHVVAEGRFQLIASKSWFSREMENAEVVSCKNCRTPNHQVLLLFERVEEATRFIREHFPDEGDFSLCNEEVRRELLITEFPAMTDDDRWQ